ncbi:MAG: transposase family protein [Candidatus Thiodiazotropha endolucinida]
MCSHCGQRCRGRYDKKVLRVRDLSVAGWRIYLEFERWRVSCPRCGGVHVGLAGAFEQKLTVSPSWI